MKLCKILFDFGKIMLAFSPKAIMLVTTKE